MPISDTHLRQAKPAEKAYKIYDSEGLYAIVNPNGGKWWRFKYRFDGKEKTLAIGTYPTLSLKQAREQRDSARKLLATGVDPSAARREEKKAPEPDQQKAAPTFEQIGREWFAKNKAVWSPNYSKRIMERLQKYLFPSIGSRPITELKTPDFAQLVGEIEGFEHIETAHRVAQFCSQMCAYACALGILEYDPAMRIGHTIKKVKETHHASIIDPGEFAHLLVAIDEYRGSPSISYAIKIIPYVFVRSGELRGASWDEIDWNNATWVIPAERMKMRKQHVVPLAPQVVELFRELYQFSGHSALVFPGFTSRTRGITDIGLLNVLRRLGYDRGQMNIHGFRSAASTMLNEMGYNRDWIEAQLAHSDANTVRSAYNRAEWLDERRKMMCKWANYLDTLKAGAGKGE